MFSRRQIKLNLPWSSNSKGFPAPALNAWFFLLEHQWVLESSVIVAHESLSCPRVKRWISKSYSYCWKGFKYTKMLENQSICVSWRIFLKNSRQFNCSGQTRDSWTTITKQKNTSVDHSGNNTLLRIKHICKLLNGVIFINSTIVFSCRLHVHIFYVKYLIQFSTK